jgi:hypothetical protein
MQTEKLQKPKFGSTLHTRAATYLASFSKGGEQDMKKLDECAEE